MNIRNVVRCAAAMAVAIAPMACGSSEEMRPVDGKFRATVEGDGVPAGSVVSVDVFWLGDGYVDFRIADVDGVVPGPDELKGVLLKDGNAVLNEGPVPDARGEEVEVRLEGVIAPERIDLELAAGGAIARLAGEARPLMEASELDGEYAVFGDHQGVICPGETPGAPRGRNLPLDVLATPDGTRLTMDGRLVFDLPSDHAGAVVFHDLWYGGTFDASVSGSLAADGVALTLEVAAEDSGPGCVDRMVLTGAKRVPDPASLDGEWRATYDWTDTCFDESGYYSAPVRIVAQDGGTFDFFDMDAWLQFDLAAGQPFGGEFFDYGGTWAIITYDGVIDPPDMAYTVTYAFNGPDGPCEVAFDVTAYKRFFFPEE